MHHWVDPAGDASSPLLRTSRSLLKIDSEIRYPQGWSPEKLLIHRGKNWWSRRDLNPNKSPGNLSFFGAKCVRKWLFRYSLPHVGQTSLVVDARLQLHAAGWLRSFVSTPL